MMKKLWLISLMVVLAAGLILSGCGQPSSAANASTTSAPATSAFKSQAAQPSQPIVLKAVLFVGKDNATVSPFLAVVDQINKAANGELVIDVAGGPELVPPEQVGEATRSGAIDIGYTPFSYYANFVPAAAGMAESALTFEQERANGYYDYLVREHAKGGLRFIGRGEKYSPFKMFATKPITDPKVGFKGLRWRSSGVYTFLKDLGLTTTNVSHDDMYTSLQNNLVDGLSTKQPSFNEQSLYEVSKYWVGPGFWDGGGSGWVMNLAKFNSLPQKYQDLILNTQRDAEPEIEKMTRAFEDDQEKIFEKKGGQHIQWSESDNQWFFDLINMTFERSLKNQFTPEALDAMLKLEGLKK